MSGVRYSKMGWNGVRWDGVVMILGFFVVLLDFVASQVLATSVSISPDILSSLYI